jgi:serum/glucocorticoid-regulated kinase 2
MDLGHCGHQLPARIRWGVHEPPCAAEKCIGSPGTSLADFALMRVIGKGSFATVLLAKKKGSAEETLFAVKVLEKQHIIKRRQVEHTRTERVVLGTIDHPFIAKMHYAFQTAPKLYIVLEYCAGGDLFAHLGKWRKFSEPTARVFSAELVLAIEYLHAQGIVYRDLKPENVLLDASGHVKLTDFGLARCGVTEPHRGATSLCGTPEYLAPEVISQQGHGTAVDWWGLGMVLHEMITGVSPWYTRDRKVLFVRLRCAPLTFPAHVSPEARQLIVGLLDRDPLNRLGVDSAAGKGADRIRAQPFFAPVDWAGLLAKRVPAPFDPCAALIPTAAAAASTAAATAATAAATPAGAEPKAAGFISRIPEYEMDACAVGCAGEEAPDDGMFSGFAFNPRTADATAVASVTGTQDGQDTYCV